MSPNGAELLCSNGKAPEVGQIFQNPTLAQTFREIGENGKKGFYEGRIAQAIVDGKRLAFSTLFNMCICWILLNWICIVLKEKGGLLELSDLSSHVSELVDPISYTYHDSFTLHECPPNGQGLTPLIALGILEQMQELGLVDLDKVEYMGVEYSHAIIEALRLAFADTRAYVSDMQHGYVPVKEVLNKVSFVAFFFPLR